MMMRSDGQGFYREMREMRILGVALALRYYVRRHFHLVREQSFGSMAHDIPPVQLILPRSDGHGLRTAPFQVEKRRGCMMNRLKFIMSHDVMVCADMKMYIYCEHAKKGGHHPVPPSP